jgi:hypothetical protein
MGGNIVRLSCPVKAKRFDEVLGFKDPKNGRKRSEEFA